MEDNQGRPPECPASTKVVQMFDIFNIRPGADLRVELNLNLNFARSHAGATLVGPTGAGKSTCRDSVAS